MGAFRSEALMTLNTYVNYAGNCAEAFTRYQEIFGGPLDLLTMAEAPGGAPEGMAADLVMHGTLTTERSRWIGA